MEKKNTLGQFFGGNANQTQATQNAQIDITALQRYYLSLVNGQLYYRLPVVSELSSIDTSIVENMAQLCAAVTPAVYKTWEQFQSQIANETGGAQHSFLRRTAA